MAEKRPPRSRERSENIDSLRDRGKSPNDPLGKRRPISKKGKKELSPVSKRVAGYGKGAKENTARCRKINESLAEECKLSYAEENRKAADDAAYLTSLPPLAGETDTASDLPELLLPAGSPSALYAAIEAGADAVYFGASRFSARANAVNFNEGEAADAIALCRAYGVKTYAAVNTRIKDTELESCLDLVGMLYSFGVDAVITADLGLCALIRERYPGLELHASTQLTPVFTSDAEALHKAGFSRMVAPRELSYADLERLCRQSPIEIEAFVHGAHCVSLSGQCLMSSLIGGRSANRGECAQPCRLPYRDGDRSSYLLSLSDMCYAADVPALIASGVRSLKVEGRKKDENYVYGVGKLYRTLLDEGRGATEDEIAALARLFERGFTDGYLRRDFSRMMGVRQRDAVHDKIFDSLKRKVGVNAVLELYADREPKLTMTCREESFTVYGGERAKEAVGAPLTRERAMAAVGKLGQTPYELRDFVFSTDSKTWLAASELNDLRRRCAEGLLSLCRRDGESIGKSTCRKSGRSGGEGGDGAENASEYGTYRLSVTGAIEDRMFVPVSGGEEICIAELASLDQLTPKAKEYFRRIYLPYTEHLSGAYVSEGRDERVGISLPPYMTDETAELISGIVRPGMPVLAHTMGQIAFARKLGARVDASFRLNVFNAPTAALIQSATEGGACVLSPELTAAAMGDISRAAAMTGCVVYGKIPVMYTVRCMLRQGGCKGGGGGQTVELRSTSPCGRYFTDRIGTSFFVRGGVDCANTVYNSVPVWMADRGEVLQKIGAPVHFYIFSDESEREVDRVIGAYAAGDPPSRDVRRIK